MASSMNTLEQKIIFIQGLFGSLDDERIKVIRLSDEILITDGNRTYRTGMPEVIEYFFPTPPNQLEGISILRGSLRESW